MMALLFPQVAAPRAHAQLCSTFVAAASSLTAGGRGKEKVCGPHTPHHRSVEAINGTRRRNKEKTTRWVGTAHWTPQKNQEQ